MLRATNGKADLLIANLSFSNSGLPLSRNFYVLTHLKFTRSNKVEAMYGSTFTFTRDTSYIASFICAHKFQARTYAKIMRQWKFTISLVFMNVKCKKTNKREGVKGGKMFTCLYFFCHKHYVQ